MDVLAQLHLLLGGNTQRRQAEQPLASGGSAELA
jgi:hypothetical protein